MNVSKFLDALFPIRVARREFSIEECPEGGFHEVEEEITCDPNSMSGVLSQWSCCKCWRPMP